MPQAHAHPADAEHPAQGQGSAQRFSDVDRNDIAVESHAGQQEPDQNDRRQRVNDVDGHGVNLLPHSFQHAVNRTVHIHDGDKRREDADVCPRLAGTADQLSDLSGKTAHQSRRPEGEQQSHADNAPGHVCDPPVVTARICFGDLRHEQSGEGGYEYGREQHNRQNHPVYDAVGCQCRAPGCADCPQSARNQRVLERQQSRPQAGGDRDRHRDVKQAAEKVRLACREMLIPDTPAVPSLFKQAGKCRKYKSRRLGKTAPDD